MPYFVVLYLCILTTHFIKISYIKYIIYIVLRTYICYTIDTVKERNTTKNPLPGHQVSRLHFENRPTKSKKGVEKKHNKKSS